MTSLMDAKRAAELLSVPPSWLLSQARKGVVPHVRLGRYVRFRESDVEDLIAAGAAGSLTGSRPYFVLTTKRDRAGATAGPMTPGGKT
jgi:excisionase family DNA binding protein